MTRWLFLFCVLGMLTAPALAEAVLVHAVVADELDDLKPRRTGRPGELTPEEEDKLDKIIDRFILYDIGRLRDPKALSDFNKLGPEAIPALIRGLNKSASMSNSCPIATIAKKLKGLLRSTEDEKVLQFARENIGAGVRKTPYAGILNDLKLVTIYRKAELDRLDRVGLRQREPNSPGSSSPGSGNPGGGKP